MITFRCPQTGKSIETGIDTDRNTLAMIRRESVRIECPHCRRAHSFRIADGELAAA